MKNGDKTYYIDAFGNRIIPAEIQTIKPFHNGFAVVQYKDLMYGYINDEGRVVFGRYYHASDFNNGIAEVYIGEKHSVGMDVNGERVGDVVYHGDHAGLSMEDLYLQEVMRQSTIRAIGEMNARAFNDLIRRSTAGMP